MGSIADNPPLIVILGQTASGKSALALQLAQRFGGEIIAADSRTVYRGMDIGTAKPSPEEQRLVRHHLIDVVDPNDPFTVADFQKLARRAINDISSRGNVAFLVGGSGLYIDAVIYNFSFRVPAERAEREKLEPLSVEELQGLLEDSQIPLPDNKENKRHLIRSLESGGQLPKRTELRANTLVIGLAKDSQVLKDDITRRVDAMVEAGFVDELKQISQRYGWDTPALMTTGYRAFRLYLAGQITLDEAKQQFVQNDISYAKRQKTWFKRNPDIVWISNPAEAVDLVTTWLNN